METMAFSIETKLDELYDKGNLSARAYNCLTRAGIKTIENIVEQKEEEIMKIRNLGPTIMEEIKFLLSENGFCLAGQQNVDNADPIKLAIVGFEKKAIEIEKRINTKTALVARYKRLIEQYEEQKRKESELDNEIVALEEEISKKMGDSQLEKRR